MRIKTVFSVKTRSTWGSAYMHLQRLEEKTLLGRFNCLYNVNDTKLETSGLTVWCIN